LKESVLHHIWSSGLLFSLDLKTTQGKSIQLLNAGIYNHHAGPDFLNAEIIIDKISWVGNVEIHVHASNWKEHGHNKDAAYKHLILHVVYRNNLSLNEDFPTLELSNYLSEDEIESLSRDIEKQKAVSFNNFSTVSSALLRNLNFEDLALQRLKRKSFEIEQYLKETKNDWHEVFYRLLAKNLGFQINSFPFEWMARSTPMSIVRPHQSNQFHMEALFFGQSGLLRDVKNNGPYEQSLWYQYERFFWKYNLKSINPVSWKFMRMRPLNFPTIRIAQLANILSNSPSLAFDALEIRNVKSAQEMFTGCTSEYWNDHFSFKRKSSIRVKKIGIQSIDNILINTVIPYQYTYNRKNELKNFERNSLSFLSRISPENNSYTRKWRKMGVKIENALKTQALIELKSKYNI